MGSWTRGEYVTIAFIFALIYGAAWVPRFGRWLARATGPSGADREGGGA